jgi:hypothetical protein
VPSKRVHKPAGKNGKSPSKIGTKYWAWGCLALVILFVVFVRIRLLDIPLERDEGEFAYGGQLILHGQPPFKWLYNIKLPGIYAAYALVMAVFGETARGIHWGLLLVNVSTVLLTFFLGRRLVDLWAGVIAAAVYGLMSLSPSFFGLAAHATQFVALAGLGGILILLRGLESGRRWTLFLSGLLFGLAFVLKQPGILFGIFGGLYLICRRVCFKATTETAPGLGLLFLGLMLPYALICLILWRAGVFGTFWLWTWTYARVHALSWSVGGQLFLLNLLHHTIWPELLLEALSLAALAVVLAARRFSQEKKVFLAGFFVFSFLAVCPGFYFSPHYFIVWFPAMGLVIGAAVRAALDWGRLPGLMAAFGLIVFGAFFLAGEWTVFLQASPDEVCMKVYDINPFRQAVEVAKYIRLHSTAGSRIAVLESEPEIYFYADRPAATGYVYAYDFMAEQDYALEMQKELIREVEETKPEYVVYSYSRYSWGRTSNSQVVVLEWADRFLGERYQLVGVADQMPDGELNYCWDEKASACLSQQSVSRLLVYKERPDLTAAPR